MGPQSTLADHANYGAGGTTNGLNLFFDIPFSPSPPVNGSRFSFDFFRKSMLFLPLWFLCLCGIVPAPGQRTSGRVRALMGRVLGVFFLRNRASGGTCARVPRSHARAGESGQVRLMNKQYLCWTLGPARGITIWGGGGGWFKRLVQTIDHSRSYGCYT